MLGPPTGTFYAIAGVISVLVMLGLVMVLSASAVTQANLGFSPYRVFVKQAAWAGMGAVALVLMVKISYRRWQRLAIPVTVLAVAAMAAPFAPGIGASVNGARSWMRAGPLSFQPSELLKIAVVSSPPICSPAAATTSEIGSPRCSRSGRSPRLVPVCVWSRVTSAQRSSSERS